MVEERAAVGDVPGQRRGLRAGKRIRHCTVGLGVRGSVRRPSGRASGMSFLRAVCIATYKWIVPAV
jgi:hypothetical protein